MSGPEARAPLRALQLREEFADTPRVDAEIGLAVAALRADVDLAAGAVGPDADDDVVAKAEPGAGRHRLDAALGRSAGHDIPAHRHRRVIGHLESHSRRLGQDHRRDVWIAG